MKLPIPQARIDSRATYDAFKFATKAPLGVGRHAFSAGLRAAAPYFLTIPATIQAAESGRATISMRDMPWVRNHLGTVHAIALCNLAEMTMGLVAESTVPKHQRWIPKGMTVEYTAKARGRMTATATVDLPQEVGDGLEVPVAISIRDDDRTEVLAGEIRIWVTEA